MTNFRASTLWGQKTEGGGKRERERERVRESDLGTGKSGKYRLSRGFSQGTRFTALLSIFTAGGRHTELLSQYRSASIYANLLRFAIASTNNTLKFELQSRFVAKSVVSCLKLRSKSNYNEQQ